HARRVHAGFSKNGGSGRTPVRALADRHWPGKGISGKRSRTRSGRGMIRSSRLASAVTITMPDGSTHVVERDYPTVCESISFNSPLCQAPAAGSAAAPPPPISTNPPAAAAAEKSPALLYGALVLAFLLLSSRG